MRDYHSELDLTRKLLHEAGQEVLRRYASFEAIEDAPADITTEVDRISQEIILDGLRREFPGDALCAEESTPTLEDASNRGRRIWVVDPIDGTRGFARKNDEFSILMALVVEGSPVVGGVFEPVPDRLTFAIRDEGCHVGPLLEPEAYREIETAVSDREDTPRVLAMSRSRTAEEREELLEGFGAEIAVTTYSAGIKMAQVARGECDLYLGDYLTLHDWDVCAGHLLVEEAGGRITDVDGNPVTYDGSGSSLKGRGVLASNGGVHERALETVAAGKVPLG